MIYCGTEWKCVGSVLEQNVEKLIKTGIKMYKDDKIIESKV